MTRRRPTGGALGAAAAAAAARLARRTRERHGQTPRKPADIAEWNLGSNLAVPVFCVWVKEFKVFLVLAPPSNMADRNKENEGVVKATNATNGYNPAFHDPEPNCNNAWRMYRCVGLFLLSSARLTQPLEQEQEHVWTWTLVPLRQQSAVHHRHSASDRPCFQAARARAVLLDGVLRQQKAGARRPLGARLLLLVASSFFAAFLLFFWRLLIALFAGLSHAPQVLHRCLRRRSSPRFCFSFGAY